MSNDLHTLSGAYALDALSPEEAELFAKHLEQCPACRDEVRELQEVAARMGAAQVSAPPSARRARVLAAADQQPQLRPNVMPIGSARPRRWAPRLVGAAAAVVLVAGGTAITVRELQQPTPQEQTQSVAEVIAAPDAHTTKVATANGGEIEVATSAEYGQLAVRTDKLPKLTHRTYQMWAVRNGRPTSVGLVNNLHAGKVMPIPSAGTTVAITIEPTGGSKTPTLPPIVSVDPQDV
jgi:anti-sigma-K factor RskA